jgi:hypothetical protein
LAAPSARPGEGSSGRGATLLRIGEDRLCGDGGRCVEGAGRIHPWKASICARKACGTGTALRSWSAMHTSVAFAVAISASSSMR